MNPGNFLDFFRNDWINLPTVLKVFIVYGLIFILLTWVDSSLKLDFYLSLSRRELPLIKNLPFFLTNILIIIPLPILLTKSFYEFLKIQWYRCIRYPKNNLNKSYYIVSFRGRVCLLDKDKHEIRWIKNWQTCLDLTFVGEWTNINFDITEPSTLKNKILLKDAKMIDLAQFTYADGILTRGTPGK